MQTISDGDKMCRFAIEAIVLTLDFLIVLSTPPKQIWHPGRFMETLKYRQFHFLGKIAHLPEEHPQWKFISAWVQKPRPIRRPQNTLRHLHADTLSTILGDDIISCDAKLKEWIPLTADVAHWNGLATEWKNECIIRT